MTDARPRPPLRGRVVCSGTAGPCNDGHNAALSPPFKPNPLPTTYRFGRHRLDLRTRQLWCGDQPVPLWLKAWQVLLHLLQRAGQLVPAADLLDAV